MKRKTTIRLRPAWTCHIILFKRWTLFIGFGEIKQERA